MIKFTATMPSGAIIIGLGLTEGNIERLRQDKPIVVKLREMGFTADIEIAIMFGKDEQALHDMLKPLIGADTITHVDPKLGLDLPTPAPTPEKPKH